nr:MAG TPA: hypothetical protein [Caudoviricetes sp.]
MTERSLHHSIYVGERMIFRDSSHLMDHIFHLLYDIRRFQLY